jgi:uncharacterized membrane protein
MMGWIWETLFCTIKGQKWDNRGFLYGPVLPIYGFGGVIGSLLFSKVPVPWLQQPKVVTVFVISFLGSILLEYATSWILEKLFHAYWWDYSDKPCNLNGRVCLQCSLGFGLAGILVVYVAMPFLEKITPPSPSLVLEALSILFTFLFATDVSLTVSVLTNFAQRFAKIDAEINDQMTLFYENLGKSEEKVEAARLQADAYHKQLLEEKLGYMLDSTNAFARGRLRQVRGVPGHKLARKGF